MKIWVTAVLLTGTAWAVDFQKEVKPILSNHCFHCHGPDAGNRIMGLRLDTHEGILATTPRGTIIVPGQPSSSLLVQRIANPKPALRMPPPYAHKDLDPEQVQTIEKWIAEGAVWKEHWSFSAPRRPALPEVRQESWVRNPIDRFILARLEKEGLQPAGPEDKGRLLRRLSLDLTGLPPTTEDLERFLRDERAGAYERMVDRYLASPRWGEHLARYWLDAARYGDTHGLHTDNYREIWPYRDWVIQAFNRNLPFDQFTIDQLAGDLLPNPTIDQRIATGFHRNHVATNEGGVIPAEVQAIYVKDQVDTTSAVWLGLTLGCATCHDHKYDPLTQKDFYQMGAFFNNTLEAPLHGEIPEPEPILVIAQQKDRARLTELEPGLYQLREQFNAILRPYSKDKPDPDVQAALSSKRKILQAEATVPSGELFLRTPFTLQIEFNQVDATQTVLAAYSGQDMRMELELESMFPIVRLEGANLHGQIAVRGNTVRIAPGAKQEVTISYDGAGQPEGITIYVNGRPVSSSTIGPVAVQQKPGWTFDSRFTRKTLLYRRLLTPREILLSVSEPDQRTISILTALARDPSALPLFETLQRKEREFREIRLRGNVTLVMREKNGPAQAHVLRRGQYDEPGEEVAAGTPAVLPPMQADWPKNRLGLAKWIVDESNPLTARVTVNRFWQQVFGTGLVKTSEDFGATGEPPVNSELLDWLAVGFRESGWDVKKLFRLMVTSATYRQAAIAGGDKIKRDPENRLLARGPRFRMDAEMLRDSALSFGGLLDPTIGGPSVRPLQPEGVWESVAVLFSNTRFYHPDSGPALHRRSLYTFWKRSAPPASMEILNAPARETCIVRRDRTDTPLQALVMLNDPDFFGAAKQLAHDAAERVLPAQARLDLFAERILSRRLNTLERASVLRSRDKLVGYYQAHLQEASAITGRKDPEAAAWVMVASQLMNLDEALNK